MSAIADERRFSATLYGPGGGAAAACQEKPNMIVLGLSAGTNGTSASAGAADLEVLQFSGSLA